MDKIKKFIKENIFLAISLTLLFIILIVIAVSYIPDWNNDEQHEGNTSPKINSELKSKTELNEVGKYAKYYREKDFVCDALSENIYLANDKSFISYDGENYKYFLYDISKKYNNEQNCLLVFKSNKKIIGYFDIPGDGYTYNPNGVVYSDLTYDKVENRQLVTIGKYVAHEQTVEKIKSKYDYIYYYRLTDLIGGNEGSSLLVCQQAIYKNIYSPSSTVLEVFEGYNIQKVFPYNVVSETEVFTYGIIDRDCYDYVDRKCIYGFMINEDLEKYVDSIAFINESYIVFKDGTVYFYERY